ncbi:MAG: SLBB domain-containing protein [Bacteroidaceae bacterium]|nr:SLBB domain-containing protein [Bacteroidaceae bacterium]
MRKYIIAFIASVATVMASAQMSEEKIIQYVQEQQEKGVSQEQIVFDLNRKGVTVQQLREMRTKYENGHQHGINQSSDALIDSHSRERQEMGNQVEIDNFRQMIDESSYLFQNTEKDSVVFVKKIYGHDLFKGKAMTFEPSSNLATPQNYRLGPGDEVIIDIWGASQSTVRETISPDGVVMVQDLGPLYLNGKTIKEANSYVMKAFGQIYSGLDGDNSSSSISLSLGQNRSVLVNVMGEVENPGTYQVSSFATVFNAIYMAGGVSDLGSMRNIKLVRNNRTVATVDMYDYLKNGQVDDDIRLEDNDAVIVSAHSILVTIDGRIRRPMSYEMKENESVSQLIDYAGGLESDAYRGDVRLIRMGKFQREIFTIEKDRQAGFMLMDGDSLYVDSIQSTFSNMSEVRGAVYRPGMFQIGEGISTVRQLVEAAGGLREDAFPSRALLNRTNPDKTLTNLSIDIVGIMNGTSDDVQLRNDDVLHVPSLFDMGEVKTFGIFGEVMFPGTYKYADNTTIEDLILQAGGLKEDASLAKIDVIRHNLDKKASVISDTLSQVFSFQIDENLAINDNDFRLKPYDEVYVRRSPGYSSNRRVLVEGEVAFPGFYSLSTNNEKLSDIITRVGDFAAEAYIEGARLERTMTPDERARMKELAEIISAKDSIALAKTIEKISTETTFNVGINLKAALDKPGCSDDIVLRDGDRIIIPSFTNTVKVNGEVMFSNTVPYIKGKRLKYYVNKAGGYTQRAKKMKSYVVYMNGSVMRAGKNSKLVQPGCEVVIPARQQHEAIKTTEILSLGSTSASLATVVLALANLLK